MNKYKYTLPLMVVSGVMAGLASYSFNSYLLITSAVTLAFIGGVLLPDRF